MEKHAPNLYTYRFAYRHVFRGDQAEMFTEIKEETRMSKSDLVKTETMSSPVPANCCSANVLEAKVCIYTSIQKTKNKTVFVTTSTYRRMKMV